MKNSIACLNYRPKLNGVLKNRINDLPRFLLPSSQSAPASQLPHFLPPFWTTWLPDHSVTVYLFILIFRAKGWWGLLPALNYPHRFSSPVMEEPKHLQQAWRWESRQPPVCPGLLWVVQAGHLVGQEQLLQPGTDWRQEIKPTLPGSHWNCFALWVALGIKSTPLKTKPASWTTVSAFQGTAEVPVRTHCPLKGLSWAAIILINKNHSELLSSKLTWQQQFSSLWLNLFP